MDSNKKAIVLLSGGLDSTTCLAIARDQGYQCYSVSFDYGQKHRAELKAAKQIAQYFQVKQHRMMTISLGQLGGSALTEDQLDVPDYIESHDIPITYVPARNTVFLSMGLGLAEVLCAHTIFIGVSALDYSGYPDCRPEYIQAFQSMANLATKSAIQGQHIAIKTPLIDLDKAQTIQRGQSLGVDYAMTVSCYRASPEGLACGNCDSCELRRRGFSQANVCDPTRYDFAAINP